MKKIILPVLLAIACLSYSQNKKPKIISTTTHVRNAEYGYSYMLPGNTTKELIETKKNGQEVILYSGTDCDFTIRLFSENDFAFDVRETMFEKYYQQIASGKHDDLQQATITETKMNAAEHKFYVKGKIKNKEFIWTTYRSEIPVSGDFICNTLLFIYSGAKAKAIGKETSKEFGGI